MVVQTTEYAEEHDTAASRLLLVEQMCNHIEDTFSVSGIPTSSAELTSMRKTRSQIAKLSKNSVSNTHTTRGGSTVESDEFADAFLDSFTRLAFPSEMNALRESDQSSLTGENLATLAETIRNFGRSLSAEEREIYLSSLV